MDTVAIGREHPNQDGLNADPIFLGEPLLPSPDGGDAPSASAPPLSKNVPLLLVYTGFAFAGRSLWSMSVLSSLLYLLEHDARTVGTVSAVMGLCQLCASLPAGYAADKHRRDRILRLASVLGVAAAAVTSYASVYPTYSVLTGALCIWGLFWGTATTSVSALFADSVADGCRSKYFTLRGQVQKAGVAVGPAAAAVLFYKLGNEWTIEECGRVMLVGQLVSLPGCLVLWIVRDDYAPPREEEVAEEEEAGDGPVREDPDEENVGRSDGDAPPGRKCCRWAPSAGRTVPILVASADVLAGLAAGMSVRYFPIFFLENLGLGPIVVQLLYILSPLLQIVLSRVAHARGRRVGRLRTTVGFKWAGVAFMGATIIAYVRGAPVWVVCVLYVARTSLMNCTQALTKSVLMDNVPRNERAKWSALESVNMFSWSGSAFVGGYLVDWEGIVFNFCCTAALQVVATMPLVYLYSRRGGEKLEET